MNKTSSDEAEPTATNWKCDPTPTPSNPRQRSLQEKKLTFGEGCVSKVYAELPEDHGAVISACASSPGSFRAANPK